MNIQIETIKVENGGKLEVIPSSVVTALYHVKNWLEWDYQMEDLSPFKGNIAHRLTVVELAISDLEKWKAENDKLTHD